MRISDWSSDVCSSDLAKIGQQLFAMSRVQPFDGFDLQQQTAIDQQIDTKGRVEARAFKMYIDRHLPIDPISTLDQLSSSDRLIDAFQQARPQFPVQARTTGG